MYDILVWGATGFTGTLAAEYLARIVNGGEARDERVKKVTWAIAGRNQSRLESLKSRLVKDYPSCKDVGIIVADSNDANSVNEAVKQVKVVANLAGPFYRYATPVVDACVKNGVHHLDITGEVWWIKKLIDTYHDQAVKNNALIVNCCGMDSIPADMLTFLVTDTIRKKYNQDTKQVKIFVSNTGSSGPSGGTFQTIYDGLSLPASSQKLMASPYSLADKRGPDRTDSTKFYFDKDVGRWAGFTPFSICDGKSITSIFFVLSILAVTRRSAQFNNYGPNFSWSESMSYASFVKGVLTSLFIAVFFGLLFIRPTRFLLQKILPKPGEGPSRESMKKDKFSSRAVGYSDPKPGETQVKVQASLKVNGNIGYQETATMIIECALCIVLDRDRLPRQGGILTPASALGTVLLDRLRGANHEYVVL